MADVNSTFIISVGAVFLKMRRVCLNFLLLLQGGLRVHTRASADPGGVEGGGAPAFREQVSGVSCSASLVIACNRFFGRGQNPLPLSSGTPQRDG